MQEFDVIFKLLIIGDSAVGKSCFLLQFTEEDFKEDHCITIGVEYATKLITTNSKQVTLQIWDSAGQESFRSITRSFYRNAHAVILMYDITRMHTFSSLSEWLREVRLNSAPEVLIYVVGNMLDLEDQREVSASKAEAFVAEEGLAGFMEASAKTSEHVNEYGNI